MQRLKTRPQFQAVLSGAVVAKTSHFVLHCLDLVEAGTLATPVESAALFPVARAWLGAMAPKRWAKRAVTRNAIKRQIYTVSTSFKPINPRAAFLVRLRREFSQQDFVSASSPALKAAVRDELLVLLQVAMTPARPLTAPA